MPMRSDRQFVEIALLVFLSFLWGSSFTLIKVAVESVPPATVVLGRLIIGAAILLLLVRLRGIALPASTRDWAAYSIQGCLQSALPFTLISWGEKHIDSGLAGLLNSTPPLFAFLIAFFILGQRTAALRKAAGVAIGFAGVLIIMGTDLAAHDRQSLLGQAAVMGSSLSYAVAAIYANRFSDRPPLLTAACSMLMAAAIMLPISVVFDQPLTLAPSSEAIWSIVALGVLSTALAMIVYFRLVRTLGPVGVTSGSYLRAGFSVLLGAVILGETISPRMMIGIVLILLSVATVTGQLRWPLRQK